MTDDQMWRYNRQMMLPQINYEGQEKLLESRVFILGAGGLGSPVAIYLATSGVGHLVISDFDKVEITNLQRQILHTEADVGREKVVSAKETLAALSSDTQVTIINHKLEGDELAEQVRLADVVVDTTDNFSSRFALNRCCVAEKTPLVSGSVIRMEGQVTVFRPDLDDEGPCYHCLYKESDELGETCTDNGVVAPVVGIIGTIQATEVLKVLMRIGEDLHGRLLLLDASTMEWRSLKLKKDPNCPVCS
ncbi:MAG: molybdopterin-synthase adenylyltransferase MoeB [Gammaproteobacteria bacterium]|nr:molybdopterin-synthase adenylyltransferase MoeB [Gammaproteobacteria bacterium]MDH5728691.1 molybdopterin-synthase adenylyltransferase MoeB [Gammaproteobacteria bacterium]